MMESHSIIHKNPFGYISRCDCCSDIQLCLGNMVLVMTEEDFEDFKFTFFKLNDIETAPLHRDGRFKRYSMQTSFKDLTLSLSLREYEWTSDLLNLASLSIICNANLN